MTDEKKESHEESSVDNAQLDSAIPDTEKKETKPETPEQQEQRERSNLGRKVKKLEETLLEMNEVLQELRTQRQAANNPARENELPEYVSTPDDVERILSARERKQQQEREKYQSTYAKTFREVGKEDPELYEEVFNEMFAHFNEVRTGDASVDAELNYARAKASVLAKKTAQPRPKANVKGEKTAASTNLSVESKAEEGSVADIQLDDAAKEFIAKTGMKPESIKDALKGEVPIHLRK